MKKRILSLSLVFALVIGVTFQAFVPANAEATQGGTRVSDGNTTGTYVAAFGDSENSTRYSGRVWTDKTVFTDPSVTFSGTVDGQTASYTVENNSDFLVAFSALATSTAIRATETVPVDVVFVLDLSGSMNWATNDDEVTANNSKDNSRLQAMVNSLNSAIDQLVTANQDTRIGIVTFNDQATNVYNLNTVTKRDDKEYLEITTFTVIQPEDPNDPNDKREADATITFRLDGSRETRVNTAGGTNIQAGLYLGMKQLADVSDTKVTVGGKEYTRQPYVILMSDGAPTTFASAEDAKWTDDEGRDQTGIITKKTTIDADTLVTSGSWWNNLYTEAGIGSGNTSNPDSGDGFMAILTAAYYKNVITKKYYPDGGDDAAKVYTIGFSTEYQTEAMQEMVDLVLDPAAHYVAAKNSGTTEIQRTAEAMGTYVSGENTTTVYGSIGNRGGMTYNVQHPTDNAAQYDPTGTVDALYYPDQYYSANDAEGLEQIFDDIVSHITTTTPEVPTEVGDDPLSDGYVTYTDPIGEYMEVKDVKAILWGNTLYYREQEPITSGNVTAYTFHEPVESPAYGSQNLNSISITVTTDPDSKIQTLEVKIPAALIPLRVNTLTMNSNGTVKTNESNGIYPMRLFYTVGMKENVIVNGKVDPTQVSQEYLQNNTDKATGKVSFYSNLYNGNTQSMTGESKTVGDATVTFEPATTNPYYFNQERVPLYTDATCQTQATWPLQTGVKYYRVVSYFDGTTPTTDKVEINPAAYGESAFTKVVENGVEYLYLAAGSPRISNLARFVGEKTTAGVTDEGGATNTANTYYYPTFTTDASGQSNGLFTVYLGNNGKLSAPVATGNLSITKTVAGNAGETNRDFTFDVKVEKGSEGLNGDYTGTITTATTSTTPPPSESVTVTFENGVGKIKGEGETTSDIALQHGETLTIQNLPAGYTFTVTENDPTESNTKDYKTTVTGTYMPAGTGQTITTSNDNRTAYGVIVDGKTADVDYTNTWDVPVTSFGFTKVDGKDFHVSSVTPEDRLSGAEFALYAYTGSDWGSVENALLNTASPGADWGTPVTQTSDNDGQVTFQNLKAGKYRLVETKAPDGYQLPKGQWNVEVTITGGVGSFEITAAGGTTDTPAVANEGTNYYLLNYQPVNPPITGGDGGRMFLLAGGALMLAGAALVLFRIRGSRDEGQES